MPGVILSLLLGVVIFLWRRRAGTIRSAALQGQHEPSGKDLWNLLDQGRASLVRGDSLSFLETALTIERCLADMEPHDASGLSALIEKVRYAGHNPQPEELERMNRGLRMRLQQKFPLEQGEEDRHEVP